jgi:hypothetical protein
MRGRFKPQFISKCKDWLSDAPVLNGEGKMKTMTATPIYILGDGSFLATVLPRGAAIAARQVEDGLELWHYCCEGGVPIPFNEKAVLAAKFMNEKSPEESRFFLPNRSFESAKLMKVGHVDEEGVYTGTEYAPEGFDRICMIRAGFETNGYAIVTNMSSGDLPNYAFTVGLEKTFGHPELCIAGLAPEVMRTLLIDAAQLVKFGDTFEGGSRHYGLLDGYPVAICELEGGSTEVKRLFEAASAVYGLDMNIRVLQLYMPDASGLFPWEAGCVTPLCRLQAEVELPSLDPSQTL